MAPLSTRRAIGRIGPPRERPAAAGDADAADASLRRSLAHCRRLMAAKGKSFAFAARFLPRDARLATWALYALFRTVDDVADECRWPGDAAALARLDGWRRWVEAGCSPEPTQPVRHAAGWAVAQFALDRSYLIELIDGVRGDVIGRPIVTEADQERYCYAVAATVGLAMAQIRGATAPEALAPAAELGIAMQLTNIVRDVGEDARRGRIYLPLEELLACGCTPEHLAAERVDDAFVALLRRQIARARAHYRRGEAGIALLPPEARFPIRLAARLYAGILDQVERRGHDVFSGRAHLRGRERLWYALRAVRERDP